MAKRQRTAATKPLDDQGSTLIKVNPAQFKVPRPATKHVYVIATREQVQALADAMPPNLALGVLLAGTLGLRQGEVLGLQHRDIELDASPALLHVRRSAKEVSENGHKVSILGETKTPSSKRDIEVPAPLAGKIREHLATYVDKKPTALLFTGVRTRGTIGIMTDAENTKPELPENVRVRFCPSPTGTPHVGMIRTAEIRPGKTKNPRESARVIGWGAWTRTKNG